MRCRLRQDDDGDMSTTHTPAARPQAPSRPAPPAYLAWLREEIVDWQRDQLLDPPAAAAILGRYHAARRFSLARLLLVLGAVFVGFGLIWLVASNLDELTPTSRFVAVAFFWVAAVVGGELLAVRRAHGGPIPSPVVHAVRILGALLFGAVVFQAAQTLQVPAYEPRLVGVWALGALLHAYVVRGVGPLAIGVLAGYAWVIWQAVWSFEDVLPVLLAVGAIGVIGVAVAALTEQQAGDGWPGFAAVWREAGVVALLAVLFVAALPFVQTEDPGLEPLLAVLLTLAAVATGATVLLGVRPDAPRLAWAEPVVGVVVTALAAVLVLWEAGDDAAAVGAEDWLHAVVSVVGYLALATGVAAIAILRDSGRLTFVAVAALAVFTTVQAFAVFAQIIQGAVLFLVVGVILAGTGWLADRGRRHLARTLDEPDDAGLTDTSTDATTEGGAR